MSFDAFQRECLAAMGYAVYALAGRDGGMAAGVAEAELEAGADTGAAVTASTPPSSAARAPVASAALLRALVRAAGGDPDDAQALDACGALLPAGGLDDARARRALWPRLRALRARATGR